MADTPIKPLLHTLLCINALYLIAGASYSQEVASSQSTIKMAESAVHWYKPLAGGPLKLLVILAADNANEVDELAQRLDMVANVIQTPARDVWHRPPSESDQVNSLTNRHLGLTNKYDCILIGKVAWDVIPNGERELIIKHVELGAGLVYVSPYLQDATSSKTNSTTVKFNELFHGSDNLGLYRTVYARTAYAFSQLVHYRDRLVTSDLPALPRELYRQSPLFLSSRTLGKGRIIALDYDDTGVIGLNIPALIPFVDTDHYNALTKQIVPARRDLWLFGLTMAVLHSSSRYSTSQVSFLIKSVVPTPLVDRNIVTPRHLREMNPRQFYRYRLSDAEYYVVPPRADESLKTFHYRIRSSFNKTIVAKNIEITEQDKINFKLPLLEEGHYLLDGFYLDKHGKVINSGNTSIQVVSVSKIRDCKISLADLRDNGNSDCELVLSQRLADNQHVEISITDISGTELQTIAFVSDAFSRKFRFSLNSQNLPVHPFVLQSAIVDRDGVVVRHRILVNPHSRK